MVQDRPFVAYFRVDGVGLAEQARCAEEHARAEGGSVIRRFRDDDSGGTRERPQLAKALDFARDRGAELIVATLWGLSRDAAFLRALHESGVEFLACDFPQANHRTIDVLAALAEYEARVASARTRAGLAAFKARGGKLGASRPGGATLTAEARARGTARAGEARKAAADAAYRELGPMAAELRGAGFTLRQIADRLNEAGFLTRMGRPWNPTQVARVLKRRPTAGPEA